MERHAETKIFVLCILYRFRILNPQLPAILALFRNIKAWDSGCAKVRGSGTRVSEVLEDGAEGAGIWTRIRVWEAASRRGLGIAILLE